MENSQLSIAIKSISTPSDITRLSVCLERCRDEIQIVDVTAVEYLHTIVDNTLINFEPNDEYHMYLTVLLNCIFYIVDKNCVKDLTSETLDENPLSRRFAAIVWNCWKHTNMFPITGDGKFSALLRLLLEIVKASSKYTPLKDLWLKILSAKILKLIANRDLEFKMTQQLLISMITLLQGSAKDLRLMICQKIKKYLCILLQKLHTYGDYMIQSYIIEVIIRFTTTNPDLLANIAKYSVKNEEFVIKFSKFSSQNYDAEARKIINMINFLHKEYSRVFTIACDRVFAGKKRVEKPQGEEYIQFWIDFNLDSRSISFLCDANSLIPYQNDGTPLGWEVLTIEVESISEVEMFSRSEELCGTEALSQLKLTLNCACKFVCASSEALLSNCRVINFFFKYSPLLCELENRILPEIMKDKLQFKKVSHSGKIKPYISQNRRAIKLSEKQATTKPLGVSQKARREDSNKTAEKKQAEMVEEILSEKSHVSQPLTLTDDSIKKRRSIKLPEKKDINKTPGVSQKSKKEDHEETMEKLQAELVEEVLSKKSHVSQPLNSTGDSIKELYNKLGAHKFVSYPVVQCRSKKPDLELIGEESQDKYSNSQKNSNSLPGQISQSTVTLRINQEIENEMDVLVEHSTSAVMTDGENLYTGGNEVMLSNCKNQHMPHPVPVLSSRSEDQLLAEESYAQKIAKNDLNLLPCSPQVEFDIIHDESVMMENKKLFEPVTSEFRISYSEDTGSKNLENSNSSLKFNVESIEHEINTSSKAENQGIESLVNKEPVLKTNSSLCAESIEIEPSSNQELLGKTGCLLGAEKRMIKSTPNQEVLNKTNCLSVVEKQRPKTTGNLNVKSPSEAEKQELELTVNQLPYVDKKNNTSFQNSPSKNNQITVSQQEKISISNKESSRVSKIISLFEQNGNVLSSSSSSPLFPSPKKGSTRPSLRKLFANDNNLQNSDTKFHSIQKGDEITYKNNPQDLKHYALDTEIVKTPVNKRGGRRGISFKEKFFVHESVTAVHNKKKSVKLKPTELPKRRSSIFTSHSHKNIYRRDESLSGSFSDEWLELLCSSQRNVAVRKQKQYVPTSSSDESHKPFKTFQRGKKPKKKIISCSYTKEILSKTHEKTGENIGNVSKGKIAATMVNKKKGVRNDVFKKQVGGSRELQVIEQKRSNNEEDLINDSVGNVVERVSEMFFDDKHQDNSNEFPSLIVEEVKVDIGSKQAEISASSNECENPRNKPLIERLHKVYKPQPLKKIPHKLSHSSVKCDKRERKGKMEEKCNNYTTRQFYDNTSKTCIGLFSDVEGKTKVDSMKITESHSVIKPKNTKNLVSSNSGASRKLSKSVLKIRNHETNEKMPGTYVCTSENKFVSKTDNRATSTPVSRDLVPVSFSNATNISSVPINKAEKIHKNQSFESEALREYAGYNGNEIFQKESSKEISRKRITADEILQNTHSDTRKECDSSRKILNVCENMKPAKVPFKTSTTTTLNPRGKQISEDVEGISNVYKDKSCEKISEASRHSILAIETEKKSILETASFSSEPDSRISKRCKDYMEECTLSSGDKSIRSGIDICSSNEERKEQFINTSDERRDGSNEVKVKKVSIQTNEQISESREYDKSSVSSSGIRGENEVQTNNFNEIPGTCSVDTYVEGSEEEKERDKEKLVSKRARKCSAPKGKIVKAFHEKKGKQDRCEYQLHRRTEDQKRHSTGISNEISDTESEVIIQHQKTLYLEQRLLADGGDSCCSDNTDENFNPSIKMRGIITSSLKRKMMSYQKLSGIVDESITSAINAVSNCQEKWISKVNENKKNIKEDFEAVIDVLEEMIVLQENSMSEVSELLRKISSKRRKLSSSLKEKLQKLLQTNNQMHNELDNTTEAQEEYICSEIERIKQYLDSEREREFSQILQLIQQSVATFLNK